MLNAGAVTYLVARPDGSGIPDRILGLDRSRSEDARSFEDLLADAHTGSLSLRGAMYGSDGRTELILERFLGADDPFQGIPIRLVLGQAAEGFGGALGGHAVLDTSSMVVQTRAGVDYACAPFRGAPSVSGVGDAGELCIFSGRVSGLLFDLRTSGTATALDDVEAAYNAVLDAS